MLDGFEGEFDFPDAGLVAVVEGEGFLEVPVGEVADEVDGGGVGGPFAEDPFSVALVEAEVFVGVGELVEVLGVLGESFFEVADVVGALFELGGVGEEVGVLFEFGAFEAAHDGLSFCVVSKCSCTRGRWSIFWYMSM